MRPRLTVKAVAVLGAGALALPLFGSGAGFAAPSRVSVGTLPSWVTTARTTGVPAASSKMIVDVVLPLHHVAAAESLVRSLSDPHSASYGKYLSAAQFNARFAPTAADVGSVRAYLAGQGLRVGATAAGNRWVEVTGTVSDLNKTFGTTLKTYSYQGSSEVGPSSRLSVPSSVAPLISGVLGLDTVSSWHHTDNVKKPALGTVNASARSAGKPAATPPARQPCSSYWGEFTQTVPSTYGRTRLPTTSCGYGPPDLRHAYGTTWAVDHGNTGKGVTVAIIDAYASPTMKADANRWSQENGVPKFAPGQYTEAGTPDPSTFTMQDECGGEVGWNEEESLDVEAVHGMAPGAKIHYVGGSDCDAGIDASINYVVQHHAADIVSNSYGDLGEDDLGDSLAVEHSLFIQAAAEGIGFYFSSGDDGDDTIDGFARPRADYPGTDPWVTAVGGTSLGVHSDGTRQFQTSWGDTVDPVDFTTTPATLSERLPGEFIFGTGGGVSKLFGQPFYQKNVVPKTFAKRNGRINRATPDISLDADPETGYNVALTEPDENGVETWTAFTIGGTSLSSPLFAGIQALASQNRRVPIGFANPTLYNLSSSAITDVRNPSTPIAFATQSGANVVVLGQDSSLVAVKGWDNTTGLGTPTGQKYLNAMR
jgi:subtilase family serine protease